jgi:transcriptional regulator with XRE-family HTH domain
MQKTGSKIREIRRAKDITIVELANKAQVSKSLISQIEREEVLPSLTTLSKIANSLGVPITEFFEMDQTNLNEDNIIVRKNTRKKIVIPNSPLIYELLVPDFKRKIEFTLINLEPKNAIKDYELTSFAHEGEECLLVLEGKLTFYYGDKVFILNEGDSASFDCSITHKVENNTDKKVSFVTAITPPTM